MQLPVDRWIRFSLSAGVGDACDGEWELSVQVSGDDPKTFPGLPIGSGTLKRVTLVWFTSNADDHSYFYLDNIHLKAGSSKP